MKSLSISVVIPLHNKAQHIVDTLLSVQNQSIPVDEIIVVDDGSTDGSADRVAALAINNVKLVRQSNQGVSAARNRGVAEAKSQFVAFLDADDEWLPFFTVEMQALVNRFPQAKVFASRYQCIQPGGQPVDANIHFGEFSRHGWLMTDYFAIAGKGNLPFIQSSMMVSRDYFSVIGQFTSGEIMGEDLDWLARAALADPIAYSPNVHVHYHCDTANHAMERMMPQHVCLHSERLIERTQTGTLNLLLVDQIKHYCAALFCALAKQKIVSKHYDTALFLLAHPLCKLKPVHCACFATMALLGKLLRKRKSLVASCASVTHSEEKII